MRRVSVVGSSGSGKTTFASTLAARLGIPFVELDSLFWQQGNWVQPDREAFRERVDRATAGDEWVADGNYHGRIGPLVLGRADTVVWLDLPLWSCLWRIVRRSVPRVIRREVLWVGNRETFRNLIFEKDSLIYFTVRTHAARRRRFAELLAAPEAAHLSVHRLRSGAEATRWLASVSPQPTAVSTSSATSF